MYCFILTISYLITKHNKKNSTGVHILKENLLKAILVFEYET